MTIKTEQSKLKIIDLVDSLPKHPAKRYHKRKIGQVNQIIIHHSYTDVGSPRAFARYHVSGNNWPGIGYHYVIDKKGNIYMTNYLDTISYHVSGQNTNSIGICMIGNFDNYLPTKEQEEACLKLTKHLMRSMISNNLKVKFHRHFNSRKTCPGKKIDYIDFLHKLILA